MREPASETRELVETLAREVADLRERVAALERAAGVEPAAAPVAAADGNPAALPSGALAAVTDLVVHLGQALLVLAGAFLLRSLTDSGALPPSLGVAAGLAYGLAWLLLATRDAAHERRLQAGLKLVLSLIIVAPLLAETTLRLKLLAPAAAAALLASLGLIQAVVAARLGFRGLALLAASVTGGGLTVLAVATGHLLPFVVALLAASACLEAAPWGERGLPLRWPFALATDVTVAIAFLLVLRTGGLPEAYAPLSRTAVALCGLALAAVHVAGAAARTLASGRLLGAFEITQGALALAIGWTGAVHALGDAGVRQVGLAGLALAAGCYFVAFAVIERRAGPARNFYAYATFGAALALVSSRALLAGTAAAAMLAALACVAAACGARFDRGTLRLHALLFLAAALQASGLPAIAAAGLLGHVRGSLDPGALLALAAGAYCVRALAQGAPTGGGARRATPTVALAMVAASLTGLLGRSLARLGGAEDAALAAAAGTAAIAAVALGFGIATARWRQPELRTLAIAWLVGGGLKLVFQDLPAGRPLTLFLAFACYGGALIALPRLLAAEPPAGPPQTGDVGAS